MKKLTLILSMMIALIGLNANAAIYIVGDEPFGGWSYNGGTEMTDNQDGSYSITATIDGSVWFVFADGRGTSWDNFNGTYRFGPTNGDETVEVGNEYTTQRGSNGAYKFTGTGDDYVITFNPTTLKFNISGYVAPIEVTTYNVVGDFNGWNVNADEMTLVNGVYTLTKENLELNAGSFQYKFVGNHDYGIFEYPTGMNNLSEPVEKHGYYDVTITFVPATLEYSCTLTLVQEIEDPIIEEHTYTVAGDNTALFGSYWDPTDTINDMTLVNGLYTWTKNAVELTAGSIPFKVVMDHDWNNGANAWPADNYVANIEENGVYDVTITFNPETKDINFTASKQGAEDYYIVAGEPIEVFGDEWNEDYAENIMTLVDGLYTWTKDSVELAANDVLKFKVVKNSNWDTCWPADNYVYTCPADGVYDLTITYNPETNEVTFNAAAHGETPEMVYTVVGPASIFGTNWNTEDTNNDMTLNEGVYTWTKQNVNLYGNFDFKVVGNHSYDVYQWPLYGNWTAVVAEEGVYTIEITFDPEAEADFRITCTLTKTGEIGPIEHTYTVAGTQNLFGSNWVETDEANDMVKGENGIYTWTKNGVELVEGDSIEFKIVQDHAWDYSWPSMNWKYFVTETGSYDVVITFNPAADDMNKITFTATKRVAVRGDADGNGVVGMDDLTALINYLVFGTPVSEGAAICDELASTTVSMDDLTALINYLVYGTWPAEPVVEHTYTVAGAPSSLFGSEWAPDHEGNDMVKGDDGKYTWKYEGYVATGAVEVEFKVVKDHSWDNGSFPASNYATLIGSEGYPMTVYIVTITFDPNADDENKIQFSALPVQIPE